MSLPTTLAVLACIPLLASPALAAPPQSAPRRMELPAIGNPLPEVRVAKGVRTFLVFNMPIAPGSVHLDDDDRARVRLVDVGERAVIVEPLVDLGKELATLRVGFSDGKAPLVSYIALVSHATEVDKEVEVIRQPQSVDELQGLLTMIQRHYDAQKARLDALHIRCEAGDLAGLALAGVLEPSLKLTEFAAQAAPPGTLILKQAWRLDVRGGWVLWATLKNGTSRELAVDQAGLAVKPPKGAAKVLPVLLERVRLAPGDTTRLAVESGGSPPPPDAQLLLHLMGTEGGPTLTFPLKKKE